MSIQSRRGLLRHAVGLVTMAAAGRAAALSPEQGYEQVAVQVAPGVHVLHQAEPFQISPVGNITVIEQADGMVLVDSGASRGSGERAARLIAAISPKPVKAVFITHWHNDHPLGLPAIRDRWPGAQVIASAATKAHMDKGDLKGVPLQPSPDYDKKRQGVLEGYIAQITPSITDATLPEAARRGWATEPAIIRLREADAPGTYLIPPTVTFDERYAIPDRLVPVEARFLGRANTSGDIVVWLPRQKVLAAGDIVVSPVPYALGGYPSEWIAVLRRLKGFGFRTLVPGHGLPQADTAYVDRLIGLFEVARARAAPLAGQQLTDEEVLARVDLSDQRRIFVGGDEWLGVGFDNYTAPVAILAYKEARGVPITS